jgi:hypothetical protein
MPKLGEVQSRTMTIDSAYRRLAVAILGLDVATLAAELQTEHAADATPEQTEVRVELREAA